MNPVTLPALRQELSLLPAPAGEDGSPRWYIFDPVRQAFHSLNERALAILSQWSLGSMTDCIQVLRRTEPDLQVCEADISEMMRFLYHHCLTEQPPQENAAFLDRLYRIQRGTWFKRFIFAYIYVRLPLFHPQKFLQSVYPFVRFFFKPETWGVIALMGVTGLYLVAGQWAEFSRTFAYFFTFEGLIFYVLTLLVLKSLHELGHAFTAYHFGARVPVIGVAFLLMFPVLYTDTTDAWRLMERRARLLIDAGGLIVELGVACLALFLWSFLPVGPVQSAAFLLGTTSWVISLMVNLNPFMRFDGYYLLSDFLRIPNLQPQSFALGRWRLREFLFAPGVPAPVVERSTHQMGLCIYACMCWLYRLFLFSGIALLLYYFVNRPFGLLLAISVVSLLILMPVWRVLKTDFRLPRSVVFGRRGKITLSIMIGLFILLFIPWQNHISVPAVIRPYLHTTLFPQSAAQITAIHVHQGQSVAKGDILLSLISADLHHQQEQAEKKLALYEILLARGGNDVLGRRQLISLQVERDKARTELAGIRKLQAALIVRAPHAGRISDLSPRLHVGRYVHGQMPLLTVVAENHFVLIALSPETSSQRIYPEQTLRFIADDPQLVPMSARLSFLNPTSERYITEPILTSLHDGPIVVHRDSKDRLVADKAVFKLGGIVIGRPDIGREYRGRVRIRVRGQNLAYQIGRGIMRIFIRETSQ